MAGALHEHAACPGGEVNVAAGGTVGGLGGRRPGRDGGEITGAPVEQQQRPPPREVASSERWIGLRARERTAPSAGSLSRGAGRRPLMLIPAMAHSRCILGTVSGIPILLQSASVARELLVVTVFVVVLFLPALGQVLGFSSSDDIAEIEFREAALAPTTPRSLDEWRAWAGVAEQYVNDHFGFRSALGRMNAGVLAALGTSSNQEVLLGKEGWLYLVSGNLVDDGRGVAPVSREEVTAWSDGALALHATFEAMGVAHVVTIIPSKWGVYPEYLPAWARPRNANRYELIAARMAGVASVPFVDGKTVIMPHKTDGDLRLYRKLDTHCSTHAGFLIYQQIMAELSKQLPELIPLQPDELSIAAVNATDPGDLHRFLHCTPVLSEPPIVSYQVDATRHRVLEARMVKDGRWIEAPPATAQARVWRTAFRSDAVNNHSVLVYGDSFTIPMIKFLIHTFSQVTLVRHSQAALDSGFIDAVKPSVVLVNLNERALRNPPGLVQSERKLEPLRWH